MVQVLPRGLGMPRFASPRIWHLSLLVLYAAIGIVNIQDQRTTEPALIALASAGFVAYGVIATLAWQVANRFRGRLAQVLILVLYAGGMGALFLVATVVYVGLENAYLMGHL